MPIGRKVCAATLAAAFFFLGMFTPLYADGPAQLNHIRIPSITLDSPVVAVRSRVIQIAGKNYRDWPVSDNHVSWHISTSGNTVLTGHSDVFAQVFRDLPLVSVGDRIYVRDHNEWLVYQISQIVEVQEVGVSLSQRVQNGSYIAKKTDGRMTLITCTRPGATHRLIIIAYLIDH